MQDLYGNIVLSGGTSMFPGMADRMSKEVRWSQLLAPLVLHGASSATVTASTAPRGECP